MTIDRIIWGIIAPGLMIVMSAWSYRRGRYLAGDKRPFTSKDYYWAGASAGMGIIWLMNTLLDALLKPGIRMNHDDFVRAGFGLVALVLGAAVAYLIMKVRWRKTFFAVVFLVLSSTLSFAQVRLAPGTQLPPPGVVRPPSLNSPWREVTGPPERLPETPRIDVHQNQFLLPAAPTTFMCQEVAGKTTCQLRPIKEP